MTEHQIIFNGEMVRAILEGRKTQTRRVIKHQDAFDAGEIVCVDPDGSVWQPHPGDPPHGQVLAPSGKPIRCPYGKVGDRLWVREVCATTGPWNIPESCKPIWYLADGDLPSHKYQVRSSIYMPRWASRINLEVTNVRGERVQDISAEDAFNEGVTTKPGGWDQLQPETKQAYYDAALKLFPDFWDSINLKRGYGWESNPLVWPINFKPTEGK